MADRHTASAVALVRPRSFGWNPETASSNAFQRPLPPGDLADRARAEADGVAAALDRAGVAVCVVEDRDDPRCPDAVFPNNWVGFHPGGVLGLYPMEAPTRRAERRADLVDEVVRRTGFVVSRTVDLTAHEGEGRFLEGTGSLVLDHVGRIAYAARSTRTDPGLAATWAREMGYALVLFDTQGPDGAPVYHTNVVLSIGTGFAVLAVDAVAPGDRTRVLDHLSAGRDLIAIDAAAMAGFAGNLLELAGPVVVLSETARAALPAAAIRRLEAAGDLVPVAIPTIEAAGGGSVRCMLAEVFT